MSKHTPTNWAVFFYLFYNLVIRANLRAPRILIMRDQFHRPIKLWWWSSSSWLTPMFLLVCLYILIIIYTHTRVHVNRYVYIWYGYVSGWEFPKTTRYDTRWEYMKGHNNTWHDARWEFMCDWLGVYIWYENNFFAELSVNWVSLRRLNRTRPKCFWTVRIENQFGPM